MIRLFNMVTVVLLALLQACAGTPPDYAPRNPNRAQEARLAQFFDSEETPERTSTVIAPLCADLPASRSGWSIDEGNWCIMPCDLAGVGESKWMKDNSGNRCLVAASLAPGNMVSTQFSWADLSLKQPDIFTGLSGSFLSDTEWGCREYRLQIDPESKAAFWDELKEKALIYRFHRDGRLVIGTNAATAKPSGNWSVRSDGSVFFNQRKVFKHAIDYGGGRFDDFITARDKQVCRFIREAG